MKKRIALILAVMLLAGCSAAVYDGPTESVWVVTERTTTQYNTYTGESQTSLQTDSYDSFGNPVNTCFYNDGKLASECKRTYDQRGNCIREVVRDHFWVFSYPVSRTDYTYDDRDRLLTTTYRNGLGIKTGGDTYTYDDEANTVYWDGTYDTQTKYLNENGDIIRTVTYSEPAAMEMETIYEYDELGRNIKAVAYVNGALSTTTERRYDDRDRLLESIIYEDNGSILMGHTYQYTENTTTICDKDGYRTVETLRPDGQKAKVETYDPDGALLTLTEYIYEEIRIPAKEE